MPEVRGTALQVLWGGRKVGWLPPVTCYKTPPWPPPALLGSSPRMTSRTFLLSLLVASLALASLAEAAAVPEDRLANFLTCVQTCVCLAAWWW